MDELLARAGSQAVTFAIRSGISLASTYAVRNVAKFLTKVPVEDRTRLTRTKKKLQTRIEIVSSAIDLIKLVAARGNTNLESTLRLTRDLKEEIDAFDERMEEILEGYTGKNGDVKEVEAYMVDLLDRIEEAIPLINLSLTTSGANLNGALPNQVSPGRLLQASDIVNKSNEKFDGKEDVLVGYEFQLTMYSIFYHRGRMVNNRLSEISWKEEFTRAEVSIWRKGISEKEYDYVLKIKESYEDGRYHDEEEKPNEIVLDVSTITRLFFSASGKLLKLEDRSTPVLVLKINKTFTEAEREDDEDEVSPDDENLVEWLAFGEYEQLYDTDSETESEDEGDDKEGSEDVQAKQPLNKSLSLLEYVLRLCVLQSNDQLSILEIDDERLALYLQDENKETSTYQTTENFDEESTPVKIVERKKVKSTTRSSPSDLTSRLKKISIEESSPSTPSKPTSQSRQDSPVPGEREANTMTPWEKDKLSRLVEQTPSSVLRRKVLNKSSLR